MALVLKVTFSNSELGDDFKKQVTFSNLDDKKTDAQIKTALNAMVASGAMGEGATAYDKIVEAEKVQTSVTKVNLA